MAHVHIQVGELQVLWHREAFGTRLRVVEDARDPQVGTIHTHTWSCWGCRICLIGMAVRWRLGVPC